ncbi:hypothetical protein MSG28_009933 [Choristoneura fumiferana]|uniref:Uncharacterized protein n=1 Tax=Choristoneura fumiferana TaxID=7141 RepID=A0ACC0JD60_CHOFU|nr:hypothetical protein MSG28_009933 [Choristoneura fumiferana]
MIVLVTHGCALVGARPCAARASPICRRWPTFTSKRIHQIAPLMQHGFNKNFNLACQEWKRTLVGTVHNIGMLVSLPILGYISDR